MRDLAAGTHAFGPQDGRLLLKVYREGVASKMGHDLVIEVKDWSAKVDVDAEDPGRSSIEATAQVPSFSVIEGVGGTKALTHTDKADIKKNITEKVLTGSPTISFRSTGSASVNGSRASVTGEMTINDTTRPITLDFSLDGGKARTAFKVVQSEFGIKPFKAFMGALKVRDDVEVELEVSLPGG